MSDEKAVQFPTPWGKREKEMTMIERLAEKWHKEIHSLPPKVNFERGDARWWILAIAEELEVETRRAIRAEQNVFHQIPAIRWLRSQASTEGEDG